MDAQNDDSYDYKEGEDVEMSPSKEDVAGKKGSLPGVELNCLMRLTDDYLLMTTSKNNAMLFIEKMHKLSQVSNFKFNMKKLKTNFYLNLQKIGCHSSNDFDNQNSDNSQNVGAVGDLQYVHNLCTQNLVGV